MPEAGAHCPGDSNPDHPYATREVQRSTLSDAHARLEGSKWVLISRAGASPPISQHRNLHHHDLPDREPRRLHPQMHVKRRRTKKIESKMITFHIGLRKTASTFLQQEIFSRDSGEHYLPLSEKGTCAAHVLKYGNKKAIKNLVEGIVKDQSSPKKDGVIISAEDLSNPIGGAQCLTDRIAHRGFHPILIEDLPITHSLRIANAHYKKLTGENVRVLLGIRKQAEILAAEYSQQSAFLFKPSQEHFISIVENYLKTYDEYLEFDSWAHSLKSIVGWDNIFIYDSFSLNFSAIKKIMEFTEIGCQTIIARGAFEIPFVNTKKIEEDRWLVRRFEGSSYLKVLVPFHRRGRFFNNAYRAGKGLDKLFNFCVPRATCIYLTNGIIRSIERRYAAANKRLLSAKEEHPRGIHLVPCRWKQVV